MIDQYKLNEKRDILKNKSIKDKEKLIYDWILSKSISLGEFRVLTEELNLKNIRQ